ncbi:MAG: S8 family serine peptidase, partial [Flavobacteriaceae bacterium]
MKTFKIISFLSLAFLFIHCEQDESSFKLPVVEVQTERAESTLDSFPNRNDEEQIIRNQVVFKFNDKATRDGIRAQFEGITTQIDTCSCGNLMYELWTIDQTQIDVEGAIGQVEDNGGGGVEGENQFLIQLPSGTLPTDTIPKEDRLPVIRGLTFRPISDEPRVNIAIIDTGVDLKRNIDASKFLYSTQNIFECRNQLSGWNFVDGNADVSAENDHSTFVTGIITDVLSQSQLVPDGIDYSILPVKAFDKYGRSTYWDIVCSFAYINQVQKRNKNIHIVNASFGYDFESITDSVELESLYDRQSILRDLIDQLRESSIVVTSAGNKNNNNDSIPHYPSGFNDYAVKFENNKVVDSLDNILGVGGWTVDQEGQKLSIGNYSKNTIDLGAKY